MVRALTKTKDTGEPYTRRPDTEACLAQAIRQAPATLRARAAIADPRDPGFLPTEALVHLSREALRTRDKLTAETLIGCLGRRCLQMLIRTIRPSKLFDAKEVRQQVQCKLYDLFANEAADSTNNELDFYEVQFNKALAWLRTGVLREAYRRQMHFEAPPPSPTPVKDSDVGHDDVGDIGDSADESPHCDPLMQLESLDLLRRIQALPAEERNAVLWKREGYKTESIDPAETTVATLCGVSGREIRDRLGSARARLKRMEEEKS